jgi:BON domain
MSQIRAAALEAPASPPSASALQQQLQSSPYWSVRQLICHVDEGRVIVRGTVPCFYLKQVAQSLALKTVGVGPLWSDIEVRPE